MSVTACYFLILFSEFTNGIIHFVTNKQPQVTLRQMIHADNKTAMITVTDLVLAALKCRCSQSLKGCCESSGALDLR